MGDIVWFIIIGVIFIILGIVFIWLGLNIWIKQRINFIIRYHMDKVDEKNKPAFCRLMGIGLLVIGTGVVVSGICIMITGGLLSFIPMGCGIVLGTVITFSTIIRYNKKNYFKRDV